MIKSLTIAAAAIAIAGQAHAGPGKDCIALGGVAIPNFFDEGANQPMIISAALMGSVQNAAGKILSQKETKTGLEMEMEHYFGRNDGGAVYTQDIGILTAVPTKPGRYMIEITYDIQREQSRGTLKGYGGQFKSYGNHPIFKRPDYWTSRGKFKFHGGCDPADAHIRALVVVSP